ncbi:hypothetical protein D1O30_02390 [Methylocystis hirsuta]|uniref:Uncharacterized protein n=1 Tax=Methylocystis hirsuta TaxID=369798 RepID=A0A3M9XKA0_9HYPH|nr:hypothetical protein D1O30_02390 [Methylocystis hirsuta]
MRRRDGDGTHDAAGEVGSRRSDDVEKGVLDIGIAALGEGVELRNAAHNLFLRLLRRCGERGEPVGEAGNA